MSNATGNLPPLTFFPLHGIIFGPDGPRCACDRPPGECEERTKVGAHPAVNYSKIDAGVSIASASGRYGLATGGRFGLLGVDIDRKDGVDGLPAWQALAAALGLPQTRVIATPTGGFHVLYRVPLGTGIGSSRSVVAPGIDIRGDGGYLVAEGSISRHGTPYTVAVDVPPVMAPQSLIDYLVTLAPSRFTGDPNAPDGVEWPDAEMERRKLAFEAECLTLPPGIQGQHGQDALFLAAIRGARHWALPESIVNAALLTHYNPRCEPPFPPADVIRKTNQARTSSTHALNTAAPEGFEAAMTEAAEIDAARRGAPVPTVALPALPEGITTAQSRRVRAEGEPWEYAFEPQLLDLPAKSRTSNILEVTSILSRHPLWAGVFQWDRFQGAIQAIKPPCRMRCEEEGIGLTETDVNAVRCWFQTQGLSTSYELAEHSISMAARGCAVDTLTEWANGLEQMGELEARAVIRELVNRGFAAGASYGAEVFVTRHLVGGIRRALYPGWKHDHVLILAGAKGLRKTTALQELFNPRWFRSQMPGLRERDGSHALLGHHGVSFDEMRAVFAEDFQIVREFITRPFDTYRDFGNGDRVRAARRCIMFGTTNPDEDLIRDPETDRRWLILQCGGKLDSTWIRENRTRIWRAAKALMLAGEASHLSDAEAAQYLEIAQREYQQHEDSETDVGTFLAKRTDEERTHGFSLFDLYSHLYGGWEVPEKVKLAFTKDFRIRKGLAASLRRLGFVNTVSRAPGRGVSRAWREGGASPTA